MPRTFFNVAVSGSKSAIADVAKDISGSPADTYTFLPTETVLGVTSSSATDKTQIVEIVGTGLFFNPITEKVILNGQTLVKTVNKFFRINDVKVSAPCAGTVYVFDSTDTLTAGVPQTASLIKSVIAIGDTESKVGVVTIPDGFVGKLKKLEVYANNAAATNVNVKLEAREVGGSFKTIRSIFTNAPGSQILSFDVPLEFASKTDIKVSAVAESGDAVSIDMFAAFEFEVAEAVGAPTPIVEYDWFMNYVKTNAVTSASFVFVNTEIETVHPETFNSLDIIGIIPMTFADNTFKFTKEWKIVFDRAVYNNGAFVKSILFEAKGPSVTAYYKVVVDGPLAGTYYVRPETKFIYGIFEQAWFSNLPITTDRL
jgi:hypothetical protein